MLLPSLKIACSHSKSEWSATRFFSGDFPKICISWKVAFSLFVKHKREKDDNVRRRRMEKTEQGGLFPGLEKEWM